MVCGIANIGLSTSDSMCYKINPESGLVIDNYGDESIYDIRVQKAGIDLDTVFYHADIQMEGNCSHYIIPDWQANNDLLLILVDTGMIGEFTDTLGIENEGEPPLYICGDANSDEIVNVSDAVYIINYVFVGGDPPDPFWSGDANCDGVCNVSDAVWIINYVFVGGNDPCDTNGDGIPDC